MLPFAIVREMDAVWLLELVDLVLLMAMMADLSGLNKSLHCNHLMVSE